ncbi:MAG: bacillithiol biosynthesis cysteine-adding enzyme BshC [Phycisphaerales bacterium]|nr:bacillithiol biosynthesis cysteine-adding enzyme BshC [Phycisphaerales bacterium]
MIYETFDYRKTGYFSSIVIDYLADQLLVDDLFQYHRTIEGLIQSINDRKNIPCDRLRLQQSLLIEYEDQILSNATKFNIELLADTTTFTITTGHQTNIFMGPLYVIYKIAQVIKLSRYCTDYFADKTVVYKFVPVFYLSSEDADLLELGHCTCLGELFNWDTTQTGAVGNMFVDDSLISLLEKLESKWKHYPYGDDLSNLLKQSYKKNVTIKKATFTLLNRLFGSFGLVILTPNSYAKKSLLPILKKDIENSCVYNSVQQTIARMSPHYKPQVNGRMINLFYLTNNARERIEKQSDYYQTVSGSRTWTHNELLADMEECTDFFSPNVLLNAALHQKILPNVLVVGGGGELAYWLELKQTFNDLGVHFPMLVLRNSFLLIDEKMKSKMDKMDITATDLFLADADFIKKHTAKEVPISFFEPEIKLINDLLDKMVAKLTTLDKGLLQFGIGTKTKILNLTSDLDKKVFQLEKKQRDHILEKYKIIKSALFPNGHLQERVDNFSYYYARYGDNFIKLIIDKSAVLEDQFTIVYLQNNTNTYE